MKWKPRLLPFFLVIALAMSLAASAVALKIDPTAAFYLLPFRAFELLLGSVFALPNMPCCRSAKIAGAFSIMGLAGIALSMAFIKGNTPFPGFAALLPCVSAALVIHSGKHTVTPVRRLLGMRLLSSVGKISYSLYLVHWPLIVFGSRIFPGADRMLFATGVLVITFVLAVINYRFVEQFFRHPRAWMSQTRVFGMSSAAILAVVGISGFVSVNAGFPAGVNARTSKVLSYLQYDPKPAFRSRTCFLDPDQNPTAMDFSQCMPHGPGTKAMLWGDSHAAHFFVGFNDTLQAHGYSLGAVSASACPPVLNHDVTSRPNCRAFNDKVFPLILAQHPEFVILSAYWPQDQATFDALEKTVDQLSKANIRVVILGETPLYKHSVPTLAADRIAAGSKDMYAPEELEQGFLDSSDELFRKRFAKRDHVTYIPVFRVVCPQFKCPLLTPDEVPVHFDIAHLTPSGSRLFAKMLTPMLLENTESDRDIGSD